MALVAVHLSITGRVQGVGYRAWAAHQARRRGVRGWVRNRRDGSVEAVLIGEAVAVEAMIDACWRGPPMAWVDGIERGDAADDGGVAFEQKPTA